MTDAEIDEALRAAMIADGWNGEYIVTTTDRIAYLAGLIAGMRQAAEIVGHSDAAAINAAADAMERES